MDEQRIARIAKTLDITIEEAREMLEEDKAIDRMKMSTVSDDMSKEQKQATKKYTNVARGKDVVSTDAYGKKRKRTVKADDVKQMLIKTIADVLEEIADKVDITNIQKTIALTIGDDNFEIDLKRKRKPKA